MGSTSGCGGIHVIAWAQTEVDGQANPSVSNVRVGASWCWHGEAVRIDAPGAPLLLTGPLAGAELRARAAHTVRRLVGQAVASPPDAGPVLPGGSAQTLENEAGFVLTDGRATYHAVYLHVPQSTARLLMFASDLPPAGVEFWVVQCRLPVVAPAVALGEGLLCYATGTDIATPHGARRIEDLRAGDLVITADDGPQPVLWAAARRISGARLFAMPRLRPVRIAAGALGAGIPTRDLVVSPDHRVLLHAPPARELFGTNEVLVQARDLLARPGVSLAVDLAEVSYAQILLPQHMVIFANGAASESFHPHAAGPDCLAPEQVHTLEQVLVAEDLEGDAYGGFARRALSASEAAILRNVARAEAA